MVLFTNIIKKIIIALLVTIIVYFFYYIKFIQENVEDLSFDILNKFVFSNNYEKLNAPNLLLFKVDDNYLKEKKLLDINNEITYGNMFPRKYIAEIVLELDKHINIIGKDFFPKGLFIDYNINYKSDVNNLELTKDDLFFIETLKKDRPYILYLPKTANHNFIENLNDDIIQEKIRNKKIIFVSTGLTVSTDGVTRRYYPYEEYLSNKNEKNKYPLISLALFKDIRNLKENILNDFSQKKIALIENKILYKNYKQNESFENYQRIQSYWDNLKIYSANYPLDLIVKENFSNAILFLGSNHSNSDDFFKIDSFDNKLSGIEVHANTLMTLFYLDGKLKRVSIIYVFFIILGVLIFSDLVIKYLIKRTTPQQYLFINIVFYVLIFSFVLFFLYINRFNLDNILIFLKTSIFLFITLSLKYIFITIDEKENNTKFEKFIKEDAYLIIVYLLLFFISWVLLVIYKQWFNWYIVSLITSILPILDKYYKKYEKEKK